MTAILAMLRQVLRFMTEKKFLNEGLPSGSERDLIEYYFDRGLTYRQIALMLGKHHHLDMNERTLKQRLKDCVLRRRGAANDELVKRVKELIMLEICTGPNSLSGYRTKWHVLRPRHKIHVPGRLVESLMREVDPCGVEQRKHWRLHHRMYVSPGANFKAVWLGFTNIVFSAVLLFFPYFRARLDLILYKYLKRCQKKSNQRTSIKIEYCLFTKYLVITVYESNKLITIGSKIF